MLKDAFPKGRRSRGTMSDQRACCSPVSSVRSVISSHGRFSTSSKLNSGCPSNHFGPSLPVVFTAQQYKTALSSIFRATPDETAADLPLPRHPASACQCSHVLPASFFGGFYLSYPSGTSKENIAFGRIDIDSNLGPLKENLFVTRLGSIIY